MSYITWELLLEVHTTLDSVVIHARVNIPAELEAKVPLAMLLLHTLFIHVYDWYKDINSHNNELEPFDFWLRLLRICPCHFRRSLTKPIIFISESITIRSGCCFGAFQDWSILFRMHGLFSLIRDAYNIFFIFFMILHFIRIRIKFEMLSSLYVMLYW